MKIAFGGDCAIVGDALSSESLEHIRISQYSNADKRIINLEQCISKKLPISGKTTIYATPDCRERIQSLNADYVTLANNHIHDCGDDGILDTLSCLNEWGIPFVGAGSNQQEAGRCIEITDNLVMLAYCQYGTHYLRNVSCAEDNKPGVNGFSLEKVISDLDNLGDNDAIVSIHWAAEYVALPPEEIISWAKKILEHPKCVLIIGHHPHIPLGKVCHNGKEAYISLGNLMFPNFFLNEHQELCYPHVGDKYAETDMLMKVSCLTHKTWQKINRRTMIVVFDTDTRSVVEVAFAQQKKYTPVTYELTGKELHGAKIRFELLSKLYALPKPIYAVASKLCMLTVYGVRKFKRLIFRSVGVNRKKTYK
ncbi:MAG: CapA family protein [Clostridia bacterium]|nr:CapA family protein [Clostridia bacterium]